MDITYIPMARGFVYLAIRLDWFSRRVLSWGLSITMEAAFCVETLETLSLATQPEIFTLSGQPVHRRGIHWRADQNGIAISMDGEGRLARQHLRRAAVAQHQIRGGVSARLPTASARLALRSANTSLFTTVGGPTRALTARHPIKPYFTRCHSAWQPNPGRRSASMTEARRGAKNACQ